MVGAVGGAVTGAGRDERGVLLSVGTTTMTEREGKGGEGRRVGKGEGREKKGKGEKWAGERRGEERSQ